jgi:copper(I)-binding protein
VPAARRRRKGSTDAYSRHARGTPGGCPRPGHGGGRRHLRLRQQFHLDRRLDVRIGARREHVVRHRDRVLAEGRLGEGRPNGMTAIFGTLDNPTDHDVTVVSGTSPVAAMIELHEVVTVNGASKMQPKAGGFTVPAHGNHQLKPGGDHIMVMGLKQPIKAGDTITASLTLKDGGTVSISAIGKDFAAGNESYAPSGSMTGMSATMSSSS